MEKNGYGGVERRRHKRVKVSLNVIFRKNEPLKVSIRTLNSENKAAMVDISEGGMAVQTDLQISAATVLWIRFTLSKTEKYSVSFYGTVEVQGKVVNCVLQEPGIYRVGIAFLEMDDLSRRAIANFVEVLEHP